MPHCPSSRHRDKCFSPVLRLPSTHKCPIVFHLIASWRKAMESVQASALNSISSNGKTTKQEQVVRQVQETTQSSRNYFPRAGHPCASLADEFHANRRQKHTSTRDLRFPESLAYFLTTNTPNLQSADYLNTAHAWKSVYLDYREGIQAIAIVR
jgi:hypothetical protein